MKKIILFVFMIGALSQLNAQKLSNEDYLRSPFNLGIGIGIDYGGFGGRLTYLASKRVGIFGAAGYNLLGLGFNAGGIIKILPDSRFCPYVGAMYGYNAVIKISGTDEFNQTYYGPSFPIGLEIWQKNRPNYLNIELVIPIRPSEFQSDLDDIKSNPAIELQAEPLPVSFSIGYHIGF